MKERWISLSTVPVLQDWYPQYEVSNFGRVRHTRTPHKVLKPFDANGKGYHTVKLFNHEKQKPTNIRVHRLIAIAFKGYRDGMFVNHIDGDKTNNHNDNLEWVTNLQNARHARAIGLYDKQCVSVRQIFKGKVVSTYRSISEAARAIGVTANAIRRACDNKTILSRCAWEIVE